MPARGPVTKNRYARFIGLAKVKVGPSGLYIAENLPVLPDSASLGALKATSFKLQDEFYFYTSGTPEGIDGSVNTKTTNTIDCEASEFSPAILALAKGIDPTAEIAATIYGLLPVHSETGTVDPAKTLTVDNLGGQVNDVWTVIFTGATAGMITGKTTGLVHTFSALNTAMEPVDGDGKKYFTLPASLFTGTWAEGDSFNFKTTAKHTGSSLYGSLNAGSIGIGMGVSLAYMRVESTLVFDDGHKATVIFPRAQQTAPTEHAQASGGEGAVKFSFTSMAADEEIDGGNSVWNNDLATGIGRYGRIYFHM